MPVQRPCLSIIIPCYNEEDVLPVTCSMFLDKLTSLIDAGKLDGNSKILFVDDGSGDRTWQIICELARSDPHYLGIRQSRNRGHQNSVLAGLMEAKSFCDVTISIDCDGQDDIDAMDEMVDAYLSGYDIVYGVRKNRKTDTFWKRFTAEGFYKLLRWMGVEVVFNHADYRLISSRVLEELANFKEVNLFLRGLIPLIGFQSTYVYYDRKERLAGKSHYSLKNMLSLAFNGITSLSIKPIRMITFFGITAAIISFAGIIWAIVGNFMGKTISGWTSIICVVCFMGGIQLLSLGMIGEYIGKIYLETKERPRYIISERTYAPKDPV